jgi:hypothetical protein
MNSTFIEFRKNVEGHLHQAAAGYLTQSSFLSHYRHSDDKNAYLKSNAFWETHNISFKQAVFDREYLYGILVTATAASTHMTIINYK